MSGSPAASDGNLPSRMAGMPIRISEMANVFWLSSVVCSEVFRYGTRNINESRIRPRLKSEAGAGREVNVNGRICIQA